MRRASRLATTAAPLVAAAAAAAEPLVGPDALDRQAEGPFPFEPPAGQEDPGAFIRQTIGQLVPTFRELFGIAAGVQYVNLTTEEGRALRLKRSAIIGIERTPGSACALAKVYFGSSAVNVQDTPELDGAPTNVLDDLAAFAAAQTNAAATEAAPTPAA